MKGYVAIILLFLLVGCKQNDEQDVSSKNHEEQRTQTINTSAPNLSSDEIFYYRTIKEGIPIEPFFDNTEKEKIDTLIHNEAYVPPVYGHVFTAKNKAELKEILIENLQQFDLRMAILYQGNEEEPDQLFDNLMYDIVQQEDFIAGTLLQFELHFEKLDDAVLFDMHSLFTTNKIEMASINNAKKGILASLDLQGRSEAEIVESIHTAVINGMEYNFDEELLTNHSPSGFFLYGKGVCQAYAMAMYILLTEAGIETRYIVGDLIENIGDTQLHAWNLVKVDGVWRHIDATNNDLGNLHEDQVSKDFYMLTDKEIGLTHIWNPEYYPKAE